MLANSIMLRKAHSNNLPQVTIEMTEMATRQVHAATPRSRGGSEASSIIVTSFASEDESWTGVSEMPIAGFSIAGFVPALVEGIVKFNSGHFEKYPVAD